MNILIIAFKRNFFELSNLLIAIELTQQAGALLNHPIHFPRISLMDIYKRKLINSRNL